MAVFNRYMIGFVLCSFVGTLILMHLLKGHIAGVTGNIVMSVFVLALYGIAVYLWRIDDKETKNYINDLNNKKK